MYKFEKIKNEATVLVKFLVQTMNGNFKILGAHQQNKIENVLIQVNIFTRVFRNISKYFVSNTKVDDSV